MGARGMFARRLAQQIREENAAVKIQSIVRMFIEKRRYERTIKAIVFMQCCQRRKYAKRELKRLKIEAKSVDHIKSLNKGLENKILQLQIKLNEQNSVAKEVGRLKEEKLVLNKKLEESGELHKKLEANKTEMSDLK